MEVQAIAWSAQWIFYWAVNEQWIYHGKFGNCTNTDVRLGNLLLYFSSWKFPKLKTLFQSQLYLTHFILPNPCQKEHCASIGHPGAVIPGHDQEKIMRVQFLCLVDSPIGEIYTFPIPYSSTFNKMQNSYLSPWLSSQQPIPWQPGVNLHLLIALLPECAAIHPSSISRWKIRVV